MFVHLKSSKSVLYCLRIISWSFTFLPLKQPMSFLLRFYFEMFIRGRMSLSIRHVLLCCSFAFQLSFFSTQISWIFTRILFFKDLKNDKTTFRKSWVSNRRYFFLYNSLSCITEQTGKQEEVKWSCVKLLIYSSQIVLGFRGRAGKFRNCMPMRWIFVFQVFIKTSVFQCMFYMHETSCSRV